MQIAHFASFAAEPASVIYMVTGAVGLLFARLRVSRRPKQPSNFMLFCKKSTREALQKISLT
jgi:hypothetical protein